MNTVTQQYTQTNQFLEMALEMVPRLLGQMNRNVGSSTYGSFDRAYWHYRTNGISSARYQEAVYTLTLLYAHPFAGNTYYRDERVLAWVRGVLRHTIAIQHRNGSFDEWYLNEGSYVATAFVSVALVQTLQTLDDIGITVPERDDALTLLRKSAHFLVNTPERTVLNQMSGAICAIGGAGVLLNDTVLTKTAAQMLTQFCALQSSEGWWSEYGGPDIGYLSLTISYLEKYARITNSPIPSGVLERAVSFVHDFLHPDGTGGGEYMARNTEYIIPSRTLPYVGAIGPRELDDRYLCYILYNWIETGLHVAPKQISIREGHTYYGESGLLRVCTKDYLLVANGYKGGSFRIYAQGKVVYDSGIIGIDAQGSYTSGMLDSNNQVRCEGMTLYVSGNCKKIREPLLTAPRAILLTLWQLTIGRYRIVQRFLKAVLRKGMISGTQTIERAFTRSIHCMGDSVTVIDEIAEPISNGGTIVYGERAAYSAVPSSKYVARAHLNTYEIPTTVNVQETVKARRIERTFSCVS